MKILSIIRKTLLESLREPQLFGLLLLFPAALMLIYYVAFGNTDKGLAQYLKIAVLNQDEGPAGAQMVARIHKAEFDGKPVFTVDEITDLSAAKISLQERKTVLLLVIPPNFSQALNQKDQPQSPAPLDLIGDNTSDMYIFASSFLTGITDEFIKQAIGWNASADIRWEFLPGTGTMSDFQFGVPGILVFGIMFGVISTATILVREDVHGTLQRLRLTRAGAWDLITGIAIAHTILVVIQLPLTFLVALLLGFKSPGSLPLAIVLGIILSVSATGLGLITASFSHNDSEAVNIGTALMAIPVFLSGALFAMPSLTIAEIGGRSISVYDIFTTKHATEAIRRILIFGDGPREIMYELVGLTVLSFLYLAAGLFFYQQLRLKKIS